MSYFAIVVDVVVTTAPWWWGKVESGHFFVDPLGRGKEEGGDHMRELFRR